MKVTSPMRLLLTVAGMVGMSLAQAANPSPAVKAPASQSPPAPAPAQPADAGKRLTPDITNQIKSEVQGRKEGEGASPASVSVALPHGRRDPFVSPLLVVKKELGTEACLTGKRCLIPDQLTLKGVVKSREGMMAMVESQGQKSYVLHERDEVYRGSVVKITTDSVVFRQTTTDDLGHTSQRTIVKRLQAGGVNP